MKDTLLGFPVVISDTVKSDALLVLTDWERNPCAEGEHNWADITTGLDSCLGEVVEICTRPKCFTKRYRKAVSATTPPQVAYEK